MFSPELLQAATAQGDFPRRAADVLQVLIAGGVTACITMLLRHGGRLTSIETALNHPQLGVTPSIESLRKSRHNDANALQAHETRLDGHDRDLERIDAHLVREPHGDRRVNVETRQPYDRRDP